MLQWLWVYISGYPCGLLSFTCKWRLCVTPCKRVEQRVSASYITWIATRNAHQQKTLPAVHQALWCLTSLLPRRRQCQMYAPPVSCNHSWQELSICVKEQSTLWQSVSYTVCPLFVKRDLMLQEATQFCVVLVHTYIKSFQFFRINAERTIGLRTPLHIFCLFILYDVPLRTMPTRV